ncbi:MAG: single-stranded DNA-binding protein [Elusimicrobia bacterium]|nr:single-stranded DNA-binding protein [Elusimicrobiota bacterium]
MTSGIRLPEINLVVLSGRLTRDPELRFIPSGRPVGRISIAVNRRFFNKTSNEWQDETAFVDINVWGDAAQRVKDRLRKGSPVLVEGRLRFRQWEAKDGTKRSSLEVEARRVQFLETAPSAAAGQAAAAETAADAAADSESVPATYGAADADATSDLEEVAL